MTTLNTVLWVIQSNGLSLSHSHDVQKLTEFLDHQGTPYRPIEVIASDDSQIDVADWNGPVLFYGSTKLVEKVARNNRWRPGVYYDAEAFKYESMEDALVSECLNYGCDTMSMERAIEWMNDINANEMFIKPAADMKEFVGGVRNFREMNELLEPGHQSRATKDTIVVMSEPKEITHEWRTIIVNGRVITGSQYRSHGQTMRPGDYGTLPEVVKLYAESMAAKYHPAPVFVLDVGELADGSLKVVECNCFNCSGWYWSDFYVIARDVTAFAAEKASG